MDVVPADEYAAWVVRLRMKCIIHLNMRRIRREEISRSSPQERESW